MYMMFFDLETTGFGFEKCAIIQLGAIIVKLESDGKMTPVDAIDLKMRPRPGKMIDQRALEINGFTVDEILSWQDDHEAYKKFVKFLSKYIDKTNKIDKMTMVGYNSLHFDSDFIRQWFLENNDRFFGSWFWSNQIDVMSEATRYLIHYRPAMINFKLGNVAKVMGIDVDSNSLHDGMYDIKTTYKIYKKIIESGEIYKKFDEAEAIRIYEEQQIEKAQTKNKQSLFTEETAWIEVN